MDTATEQFVRTRAKHRCEYCHFPQAAHEERFSIDHIIARKHSGGDEATNLAFACLRCNLCKGPNLSGIDPKTGDIVELFHPRRQPWEEHFAWRSDVLIGRTATGRASIQVMRMNAPERCLLRRTLISQGLKFQD